jgi:hypothetical protein
MKKILKNMFDDKYMFDDEWLLSYKCRILGNLSTNVTITLNAKFMLKKITFFCIHIKNVN